MIDWLVMNPEALIVGWAATFGAMLSVVAWDIRRMRRVRRERRTR